MHQQVLAIALPAILANSSAPLVGLVDTWAIGHLPGPEHLAAIGLGSVIFNYLLWAFGFLRMGTTGLVAQAHGRSDTLALARVLVQAGALALLIGVAMLLLQDLIIAAALRMMAAPAKSRSLPANTLPFASGPRRPHCWFTQPPARCLARAAPVRCWPCSCYSTWPMRC